IDKQACQGCGECTVSCPNGAIAIRWDSSSRDLQEKMADYALAVLKNKRERSCFFNFLVDITPDCDCFNRSDAPIVPNIGILASRDPVAIDQASLDLIKKQVGLANSALGKPLASGEDKFKALRGLDATIQIRAAEGLGLGSRKYKLVEI
ncbi:4Fe-4S ferredoxin, partial [Candidatus Woesearchaeota archaeon CG10_big_fil_rev_8_21_14_0_10_47_5]